MPIKVTCPKCQGVLHAPDDAGGKRGKCPTCGTVLAIPAAGAEPAAQPFADAPPARPAARPGLASSQGLGSSSALDGDARRSSFGAMASDPAADGAKVAANRLPPAFGAEPKRPGDPFAKKARPAADAPAGDSEARGYRRARRGLLWCGLAYTLFLVAVAAYVVVPLLSQFGVKLPAMDPGYLKQPGLSAATEIHYGATLVPAALGLLLLTLGRVGAGGAPAASGARGTFKLAGLATFATFLGLIAYAVPTGAALVNGVNPDLLLLPDEPSGIAQRAGLAAAAVFAPLAELLFWVGLGRLGAGLGDARLTGRVTRYYFYAAAIYVVVGVSTYAVHWYESDITRLVGQHVTPQVNNLGKDKATAIAGVVVLVALSAWLIYTRVIGSARRAVRGWLDRHA